MKTVYVLLMLFSAGDPSRGGVAVVQQEFSSFETCTIARKALAQAHTDKGLSPSLWAHGCFKK